MPVNVATIIPSKYISVHTTGLGKGLTHSDSLKSCYKN